MIVSSPGRICLFGEHQDYLGLPVIAAAISLRLTIEGSHRDDMTVSIDLPDMDENETFSIKGDLVYDKKADYFRSAINVMRKDGFTFSAGFDCSVNGDIPIQAGTASSSAMVVSWINFLARMSDQKADLDPEMIADLAYRAEVVEFREAGGMMDQYVSALGGVIYLESELVAKFGDGINVLLPITDPYVVHHGALGSFATIHLPPEQDADTVGSFIARLDGITEVHHRDRAIQLLELPGDRIGELVALSARDVVIGKTPEHHDLSVLEGTLRSHGGRYEEMVPMILSSPLSEAYTQKARADLRNFDIFDVVCNGREGGRDDG